MGLPARKINEQAQKQLEEVTLSLDGKRLIFLFESGEGYSILRTSLPNDDLTPITSIQIFDHRGAVSIHQSSGQCYDLPWDSIKYYAQGRSQKKIKIGLRLKKIRTQQNLSQNTLAKKADLSRGQLIRLEGNSSTPNLDTLLKLCQALHISPHQLTE